MIDLAKDMLVFMLLLPFLLVALVVLVLLEAVQHGWDTMNRFCPGSSAPPDSK